MTRRRASVVCLYICSLLNSRLFPARSALTCNCHPHFTVTSQSHISHGRYGIVSTGAIVSATHTSIHLTAIRSEEVWHYTCETQGGRDMQKSTIAYFLTSLPLAIKIGLVSAGLLVPQGDANPDDLATARTFMLFSCLHIRSRSRPRSFRAGEILEIGAFWSIRTKDIPSFDRYFSQLQTFYNDYRYAYIVMH